MIFDSTELQKLIAENYVVSQKHPKADLWIYNYSQKTQYDGFWNDITLKCRGLILDKNYGVVARPFVKFFNLEQHQNHEIPTESFEVFEKLDGSLGILYWLENKPYIATRGSFNSEQAIKATEILHDRYSHTFDKLDRDKTYLFEIIYPENRIVVDYHGKEELILLAIIDNQTGSDIYLQDIGFQVVKTYNGITEIAKLRELELDNAEGFVIKFKNNFRVKLKFTEYIRLHRIMTGVSNIAIWEYLLLDKPLEELLEKVPDEFYDWVKITEQNLSAQFKIIEDEVKEIFKNCPYLAENTDKNDENNRKDNRKNRKEIALYFRTQKYDSILFAMLDNKNYAPKIWQYIRPVFAKPFRSISEEE